MRVYIDTSVFGGYFDAEFEEPSKLFFKEIELGNVLPVISSLTVDELKIAPEHVRLLFEETVSTTKSTIIEIDDACLVLAGAYLAEKALPKNSLADGLHIACATLYKADVLVSWNFKHIVNLGRIRLFNSVNLKYGHSLIEIRSPKEILL